MRTAYLAAFLLLLFIVSCQSTDVPAITPAALVTAVATPQPLPTLSPAVIAEGQAIYAANCANCHGENLEGEPNWKEQNEDGSFRAPPHDENGHTWHHGDNTLIEAIEKGGARLNDLNVGGTSNMPAFEEILTPEEITAVLTYIKSTWPEDVQAIQWEVTQRERAQSQ
jgi:mono/diheme cytochrome c family protein